MIYDEENNNKTVKWCINLEAIVNNYPNIVDFDTDLAPFNGPAMFINGKFSLDQM